MLADSPGVLTNLPAPMSTFVGRERELAELARLLRQARIVTLTGPGGTGKTRLALRAAANEIDAFDDGVWLVELAPITTPDLVAETLLQVVRASGEGAESPLGALTRRLANSHALIVLDNCEHLIDECARLAAHLLARCPTLTLLATSREPLMMSGERVVRVAPLDLPPANADMDEARLLDFDGIRLFLERAQAAEPSFRLSSVTAPAIVEICRRLDGIPLALELAAMRVRGMGVAYLSERLNDRFHLLTSGDRASEPRQRTLDATVAWSYDLLSEAERRVLRQLGVFAGDFSPEAAEVVCTAPGDSAQGGASSIFDELSRLVDKSLVQFDHDAGLYRLLETIRLYCLGKLNASGDLNHARRQHFVYYLQLAEDGAALLSGPGRLGWFARLEQEHDNFRAALSWSLAAERTEEAARLALSLWRFWHARTYQREGIRWLEQILALDTTHPLPAQLRAPLLSALGSLANIARKFDRSREYSQEALRLWTEAGDRQGMAQALSDIGWCLFEEVRIEEALAIADKALPLAEDSGDKRLLAGALSLKGLLQSHIGVNNFTSEQPDLTHMFQSAAILERSLALWRELGDESSEASTLATLGAAYVGAGEVERAKPLLLASARWFVQSGDSGSVNGTLVVLMNMAGKQAHDPQMARDAALILGVLLGLESTITDASSPWNESEPAMELKRRLRRTLGDDGFEQAFSEGGTLSRAEVFAVAERIARPANQSNAESPSPTMSTPATLTTPSLSRATQATPHTDLTRRELEVLRLVAQGLTNAQVGRELVITPRTVNAHLTSIYGKLGVTSRSGAIRYAITYQLA